MTTTNREATRNFDRVTAEHCAKIALRIGKAVAAQLSAGRPGSMVRAGTASATGAMICEAICCDVLGLPGVPAEWEERLGE